MDVIWERDDHTGAKHEILRRYLGAWYPKLAWAKRIVFIDGFAGPGEYRGGEPGSPRIALDVARTHPGLGTSEVIFLFIEEDAARHANLEAVVASLDLPSNLRVNALHGTFEDHLAEILRDLDDQGQSMAPTLVMVDPFGVKGMPLALLKQIAAHPRSEFLISLMYEPISRFKAQPEFEPHLDAIYGVPDWRRASTDFASPEERRRFLLELYVNQLKAEVQMAYVTPFEMRDSGNRVEYYLIHATKSYDGLKAIKSAMWGVDPTGNFGFSEPDRKIRVSCSPVPVPTARRYAVEFWASSPGMPM